MIINVVPKVVSFYQKDKKSQEYLIQFAFFADMVLKPTLFKRVDIIKSSEHLKIPTTIFNGNNSSKK